MSATDLHLAGTGGAGWRGFPVAPKDRRCPCMTHEFSRPLYPISDKSRCRRFHCSGCKLYRPWCCGADGPLCDDCWAKLTPVEQEDYEAKHSGGVHV